MSLTGDLRASSSQLDEVTQRIRALEARQANPELELELPAPAPATTAVPLGPPVPAKPAE